MADDLDQDAMAAAWEAEAMGDGDGGGGGGGDDAFAAEWEAMVGGETGKTISASAIGAERVLNQDEIDSLLGFDLGDDDSDEKNGIRGIINSA
ncbi:MAG: flagellar motor switch protein FliM, partial [Hyphomonadaceae bacterium]